MKILPIKLMSCWSEINTKIEHVQSVKIYIHQLSGEDCSNLISQAAKLLDLGLSVSKDIPKGILHQADFDENDWHLAF